MYRVIFCAVLLNCLLNINSQLVNKEVERVIDLSSQLVKITATITIENTGKTEQSNFLIYLEPDVFTNLSYISVKDAQKNELDLTKIDLSNEKTARDVYNVKLPQPFTTGRPITIKLEKVFTNLLNPYPSSITQKEKQLVRYYGSHYFYSPYPTTRQTTSVIVNSRNIESYTKLKPVSQTDSTINYGPYSNVLASTLDPMIVHFESNAPFLTVTRLERSIDVSHWGNIAVQENIDILHTGAKLKGSFSRYDYQRDTNTNHHSIKSYKTILPASAHNVYYRDSNGNISTSQIRLRKDWIELELRPRYPLFGGWKSSYTLGYSVPSYQYLYKNSNNRYLLRMRLIDNVFDDMHVDELETSVALPMGATDIKLSTPYGVERLNDSFIYNYLDFKARTIIKFRKTNLVEQHIQDFEITYSWSLFCLLHQPIVLSIFLAILFAVVIIYGKFDFSISKSEKKVQ